MWWRKKLGRHEMECRVCGEVFDMRDLTQVMVHEHHGPVPVVEIVGQEVTGDERAKGLKRAFQWLLGRG